MVYTEITASVIDSESSRRTSENHVDLHFHVPSDDCERPPKQDGALLLTDS